jgi:adenosylhomocysteine nucleosidase
VIGVVVALETERRWIPRDPSLLVERCGMGAARAEAAARNLLSAGADALVSWGSAGGLEPSLEPGTVVIPDRVLVEPGKALTTDNEWSARLRAAAARKVRVVDSPLLHIEHAIANPADKGRLFAESSAAAADMESCVVGRIAGEAGLPWIAVRVVLDAAGTMLPPLAMSAMRDDGRLDPLFLWRLATTPRQWAAFLALARANRLAGRAMMAIWATAGFTLAR